MDKLDQLGYAQNTIIALIGDHGWTLGEHKMYCKYSNFNSGIVK